jgi:hypothetical protein
MRFVHVNWAEAAAFWAVAAPDFFDFASKHVLRHIVCHAQDTRILETVVVAKALIAGANATHNDA